MACLENRDYTTGRKEWEHHGKGSKTNDHRFRYILVDTEKEVTGWKEDQRRVRSRSEEERFERNLHSASPILVMLRAGERCLWCCLKTATKFLQALGFLLPPSWGGLHSEDAYLGRGGLYKETQRVKTSTSGNTQHGRGILSLLKHTQETAWGP